MNIIREEYKMFMPIDSPKTILDAGANIHLIYPKKVYDPIQEFIRNKLIKFCESGQFINDMIGIGPLKL